MSRAKKIIESHTVVITEAVKIDGIIKELIDTSWSGDNASQMKAVQLLKGIATSDEPAANAFMKKLDKFTSGMKASAKKDESLEEANDPKMDKLSSKISDFSAMLNKQNSLIGKATDGDADKGKKLTKEFKKASVAMDKLSSLIDELA